MMGSFTTIRESVAGRLAARAPARILLVTHGYPPRQTGGAENQAQRKARWWAQRGDNVRVLAADPHPELPLPFGVVERAEGHDGHVSVSRLRFHVPNHERPFDETFHNRVLAPEIEREIASFKPDLVYQVSGYLFGLLPLEISTARGIPSVLFAMDFWHECARLTLLRPDGTCCPGPRDPADCAACRLADRSFSRRWPWLAGPAWTTLAAAGRLPVVANMLDVPVFIDRRDKVSDVLAGTSLVVVNSNFLASRLRSLGVPDERLLIVRQGLDRDTLSAHAPRQRRDDALRVLYLGQITRHKGVDLAARAVTELAGQGYPVQLRVHGQPTGDTGYLEEIAAFGESGAVEIGEPLEHRALMQVLQSSDVLVVPSRWYENSPNVILESFAAGVPVIVAGQGGMAEMVIDGVNGLCFSAGNATSLAGVLRRLCNEPELLDHLRSGITPPGSVDEEMWIEEAALIQILGARV